jgi:hypothetical protein
MTVLPDADGPFKLRVTDGKLKGSWLRTITVSKGEAPFEVTNWESIRSIQPSIRKRRERRFQVLFPKCRGDAEADSYGTGD